MWPKWLKPEKNQPLDFTALEAAVRTLIRGGKHKTALDQAKDLHKAHGTLASEALLLDAYAARIQSLIAGGLTVEATALVNLVRERYPAARDRLASLTADNLARSGKFDELLAPLNDPALSPERLATIERAIQERIPDPALIASCPALPAEHPLRQAASALQRAFAAVTTGPATDEILALPEVSRRSPLAPWKMLVGALAWSYRRDAGASRRYLAAIPPGSAAARLIPVIEAINGDGKPNSLLTAAGKQILSQVMGKTDDLKHAARHLDEVFDQGYDDEDILRAIRALVAECRLTAPAHFERLKQYISIRARIEEIDNRKVMPAMGGAPLLDAAYLSMLAGALERDDQPGDACLAWHVFRKEAVEESWFPAEGPEVAAIYLHIAGLLRGMEPWELQSIRNSKTRGKDSSGRDYILDAAALYERASALDPHPGVFSQWLGWAKMRKGRAAEEVAERWRAVRPRDIEPLLFLISAFEKRNAFPSALRYLAEAEQIDGVNPDVRKARLRLTSANFFKQVQLKPLPPVATKTLAAISAMPQTQQGDRPAFVQALHYILAKRKGTPAAAQGRRDEMERLLGSAAAASLLIYIVANACKCEAAELPELPKADRDALPAVLARVAALAGDLELVAFAPFSWVMETFRQFAKHPNSLDISQLRHLGECIMLSGVIDFAYGISAEGLTRGVNAEAEFLLLRARSLLSRNHDRAMICALAAAGLARQRHDLKLAADAVDFLDEMFKEEISKLEPAQIEYVLKTEKAETSFPKPGGGPTYSDLLNRSCDCPACRAARGEEVNPFEGDGEFDDDDPFDGMDFDLPRGFPMPKGMPPELAKLLMATAIDGIARNESPDETAKRVVRQLGLDFPPVKRGKKRR